MAVKKNSTASQASVSARWITEIGGVKVKLAPAKRVLPKADDARLRQAVRDFYGQKKGA